MATAAQAVQITGTTPALRRVTLGVVVGNRGFFPHHLALSGRKTILASLERAGINAVILDEAQTSFGAVESLQRGPPVRRPLPQGARAHRRYPGHLTELRR